MSYPFRAHACSKCVQQSILLVQRCNYQQRRIYLCTCWISKRHQTDYPIQLFFSHRPLPSLSACISKSMLHSSGTFARRPRIGMDLCNGQGFSAEFLWNVYYTCKNTIFSDVKSRWLSVEFGKTETQWNSMIHDSIIVKHITGTWFSTIKRIDHTRTSYKLWKRIFLVLSTYVYYQDICFVQVQFTSIDVIRLYMQKLFLLSGIVHEFMNISNITNFFLDKRIKRTYITESEHRQGHQFSSSQFNFRAGPWDDHYQTKNIFIRQIIPICHINHVTDFLTLSRN